VAGPRTTPTLASDWRPRPYSRCSRCRRPPPLRGVPLVSHRGPDDAARCSAGCICSSKLFISSVAISQHVLEMAVGGAAHAAPRVEREPVWPTLSPLTADTRERGGLLVATRERASAAKRRISPSIALTA
jgi:hypothetical protein